MFINSKIIMLTISLIVIKFDHCRSQDTLIREAVLQNKIVWTGKFPPDENDIHISFSKKISNFIFGRTELLLNKPISVLVDDSENLWITDQGNKKIVKVKNNVGHIPRPFNKGSESFSSLVDLCLSYDNNVLFTDSHLNTIFILNNNSNILRRINESLELKQPTGIAYSRVTKEIWVSETAAHRISVLNESGELLRSIGKRGKNPGEFNYPTFIWIDKLGTIYVVDSLNFRIQIFDKTGKLILVFGEQGDGSGNFARPKGIAVDSYGNIYVTDALFHVVQIFDKSGNYLHSFGSQGRENGQFWMPTGIFIDDKNNIYVADSYNSRIQIFKLIKNQEESN